jgi:hypothetical protein
MRRVGGGEAFTQEKNTTTQNPLSDFLSLLIFQTLQEENKTD